MTKLSKSYKSSLTIKTVGWLKNLHSFGVITQQLSLLLPSYINNGENYCLNNLNEESYVCVSSFGVMAETKMHRFCNFHIFVLRICHFLQKGENSNMYLSMVFAIYLGLVQVLRHKISHSNCLKIYFSSFWMWLSCWINNFWFMNWNMCKIFLDASLVQKTLCRLLMNSDLTLYKL